MVEESVSFRQRAELRLARLIPLLGPRLQVRLSGRPPVQRDGQTLAPDLQLMLASIERRGRPPYEELSLERARVEMRAGAIVGGGPPDRAVPTRELQIQGPEGALRARLYTTPPGGDPAGLAPPLIVFLHGGGFVLGDLDSHDVPCRLLARHAGAHVLSVAYGLAPEHPFPAPVEDCRAAFRWALSNARALGADPGRVAIAGDSAGGSLAAGVSWLAVQEGQPPPCLQILIYPATDMVAKARSHELFDEGFLLTRRDMDWFADRYLGAADRGDPRASIVRAPDLRGLPPTLLVTAGFDPLRDEGETLARRLREAGCEVLLRRYPDLIHGFINLTGISRSARDATLELAGMTRALLTTERVAGGVRRARDREPAAEARSDGGFWPDPKAMLSDRRRS
jgi:acetyl esterase